MLKKFLLTTAISIALIAGAVGANWSDPAAHNDGTLPTTAIQPIDKQILYILFIQKMNAKMNRVNLVITIPLVIVYREQKISPSITKLEWLRGPNII